MSQKRRRKAPPRERPYVSNLELREALEEKLSERELNALEKQIATAVSIATDRAAQAIVEEAHKRHWAVTMRVLIDQFGWGKVRLRRLFEAALEYYRDMEDGRITLREMLDTLEHEDLIGLDWKAKR